VARFLPSYRQWRPYSGQPDDNDGARSSTHSSERPWISLVLHRRLAASLAALLLAFALLFLFGGWLMITFSASLIFIALNIAAFHTVPWPDHSRHHPKHNGIAGGKRPTRVVMFVVK
jgi:hypothetical protein